MNHHQRAHTHLRSVTRSNFAPPRACVRPVVADELRRCHRDAATRPSGPADFVNRSVWSRLVDSASALFMCGRQLYRATVTFPHPSFRSPQNIVNTSLCVNSAALSVYLVNVLDTIRFILRLLVCCCFFLLRLLFVFILTHSKPSILLFTRSLVPAAYRVAGSFLRFVHVQLI